MEMGTWTGLTLAVVAVAVASIAGWWWRSRQGRPQPMTSPPQPKVGHQVDLLASLGVVAGTPVTLVQFSSAFCAPCRATRVICGQLAERHDGVAHLEVDAESELAAVRALAVWRTPTVFVIDHAGQLVTRITGQPTRAQLVEAVAPLLPEQVRP